MTDLLTGIIPYAETTYESWQTVRIAPLPAFPWAERRHTWINWRLYPRDFTQLLFR
jgi:hypothetical protein